MAKSNAIRAGRAFVELFADNRQLVRSLRQAERQVKQFGQRVQDVGRQMAKIGAAMMAPFALSTKVFATFDDAMLSVKSVTGAAGEAFESLTEKAKELGRTTSFTAREVAGAMLELGRAGFAAKEINDSIAAVMNLSRATGSELAMSTTIAAATLRAFGLDAAQMGRVVDVLTATANSSAQTLEELGESMKYAAPIADTFGLSLEDLSKSLGALANIGIKGSMAGTTLKNIMLRLTDSSIQASLKRLGVQMADTNGNFRNLADIMRDLGAATKGMGNVERLEVFNKIFGLRAIAGGSKLVSVNFERLIESVDNAGGTASRTAKIMDSGLGGALRRLWSVVEGVGLAIGNAISKPLAFFVELIAMGVKKIVDWVDANKTLVIVVASVAAGVLVSGFALIGLGIAIKAAAFALGTLSAIAATAGVVFKVLAGTLAFLTQPIVMVIAAVAALGAYLVYASGAGSKALAWLGEQFNALKERATESFGAIGDALAAGDMALAAKVLWLTLKMEFTRGVNALQKMWLDFRNFFIRIAYDAWDGALAAAAVVWHALESGWIETTAFLSRLWSMFEFAFVASWETMKAAAKKAWVWIKGLFDDALDTEAAYKEIDDAKDAAIGKSAQKFLDKDDEVERRRQSRKEDSSRMRDATLEEIGKQNAERHAKLDDAYTDKMTQNAAELEAARKEWQDALGTARQKRAEHEAGPGRMRGPGEPKTPDMSLLAGAFDSAVQKMTTSGGFSGMARFGADAGAADRTANATEQIAKTTREMLQLQRDEEAV